MPSGRLTPGATIGGDFRVVRALAEGGMGVVYVVDQLSTGKQRALKLMRPEVAGDDALRRFTQEARVSGMIRSEHVVDVIAAGVEGDSPWLAMELLRGEGLDDLLEQRGHLAPREVLEIFAQLCHALSAAHDIELVHRDLKPENIYLAKSLSATSAYFVKVLDFGVAKLLRSDVRTTVAVGSPLWMAPEQTRQSSDITCATDVWALGLIAYRMLSGKHFWLAGSHPQPELPALIREIAIDPIPSVAERSSEIDAGALPPGFDEWFTRCIQRDPKDRYPHAREAWYGLERVLGDPARPLAVSIPELSETADTQRPPPAVAAQSRALLPVTATRGAASRSGRWGVAALALGAVVVAGVLVGRAFWADSHPSESAIGSGVAPAGSRALASATGVEVSGDGPVIAPEPEAVLETETSAKRPDASPAAQPVVVTPSVVAPVPQAPPPVPASTPPAPEKPPLPPPARAPAPPATDSPGPQEDLPDLL
jgi:tRNA A-37 threonylcarbamoyl transferase component Bud32